PRAAALSRARRTRAALPVTSPTVGLSCASAIERLTDLSIYDTISGVAENTAREAAQRAIAENRKARHDYHVLETYESGVALFGTEVKAIREGRVNLRDSYARVDRGEVWMMNVHISPYSHRGYAHH